MDKVEPRIIQRLSAHRDRILRAQPNDSAIDELCRNYDEVIEALEGEGADKSAIRQRAQTRNDLLQLARELEQEMLRRLASYEKQEKGKE